MNSSQIHDFETKNSEKKKISEIFFGNFSDFFFRFVSYFFVAKVNVMNYIRTLKISAPKDSHLW